MDISIKSFLSWSQDKHFVSAKWKRPKIFIFQNGEKHSCTGFTGDSTRCDPKYRQKLIDCYWLVCINIVWFAIESRIPKCVQFFNYYYLLFFFTDIILQKFFIVAFAIVAAVSGDVSHLQGYNYPQPNPSFNNEILSGPVASQPAHQVQHTPPQQKYLPPKPVIIPAAPIVVSARQDFGTFKAATFEKTYRNWIVISNSYNCFLIHSNDSWKNNQIIILTIFLLKKFRTATTASTSSSTKILATTSNSSQTSTSEYNLELQIWIDSLKRCFSLVFSVIEAICYCLCVIAPNPSYGKMKSTKFRQFK